MLLDASEIGKFREEEPGYLKGVVQIFDADCHVEFIRVVTHDERDTDGWKQEAWGDNSTNEERLADLLDGVAGREASTVPGFDGEYVVSITPFAL